MSAPATTTQTRKPWRHKLVDGWHCVYLSDGQLGAKFIREGDALTFAYLAGPGSPLGSIWDAISQHGPDAVGACLERALSDAAEIDAAGGA